MNSTVDLVKSRVSLFEPFRSITKILRLSFIAILVNELVFVMPAQAVTVSVTIAPLGGLVAPLLGPEDKMQLLLKGNQSPHGFQLKPSQLMQLQHSDLVVSNGAGIDSWVDKAVVSQNLTLLEFAKLSGLTKLTVRKGGLWQAVHDEHNHGSHGHDYHDEYKKQSQQEIDGHFWLSLNNAKLLVEQVSRQLQSLKPNQKTAVQQRTDHWLSTLDRLHQQSQQRLLEVRQQPFLVLHDAFQYFQQAYGLNGIGSLQVNPAVAPSMQRVYQLRQKVLANKVVCVFREPQFPERRIAPIVRNSSVKTAQIDPLGVFIENGVLDKAQQVMAQQSLEQQGYMPFELFYQQLVGQFDRCLKPKSQ